MDETELTVVPREHEMTTVPKPTLTPIQKREIARKESLVAHDAIVAARHPDDSWIVPRNVDEAIRMSEYLCKGHLVPREYDTPQKVFTGMAYLAALGLKGIVGLAKIYIVNGRAALWGDMPLALAMADRHWTGMVEYFLDAEGKRISSANGNLTAKPFMAYCYMRNSRNTEANEHTFSLDDAKDAGLFPGKTGTPWASYTRDMLKYKARSRAIKDQFANVLNGMPIAESDYDMIPDSSGRYVVDQTQLTGRAASLGDALAKPAPTAPPGAEEPKPGIDRRAVGIKGIEAWLTKFEARGGNFLDLKKQYFKDQFFDPWCETVTEEEVVATVAALRSYKMS